MPFLLAKKAFWLENFINIKKTYLKVYLKTCKSLILPYILYNTYISKQLNK